MTREELKKAIEKGESVWYIKDNMAYCIENKFIQRIYKGIIEYYVENEDYYDVISLFALYKTKAEAEHYLHHANITRIEELPFLTWEEFLEKKDIRFYTKDGDEVSLYITDDGNKIYVMEFKPYGYLGKWNATEVNFYKAYDECVRLFKEEE